MTSDHDSEGQKGAAEKSTRRKGEGTLSSLAKAIQSLAADYQSNQAQQRAHDRRVLCWTVAGAAAIFVYTLVTLGLFIGTVIHNGITNKISRRANEISRQSFVAVQRAFVNVDLKVEHEPGLMPGDPGAPGVKAMYWTFTPIIENSGNTQTRRLEVSTMAWCPPPGVGIALKPLQGMICKVTPVVPGDPQHFYAIGSGKTIHSILGPHAKREFGGAGVTENFIEASASSGTLRWYVFGVIHYEDIFPQTQPHITKYCYQIEGTKSVTGEIRPVPSFCEHWNCADDECDRDRREYEEELAKEHRAP
jgi:hypothetical protein